MAIIKNEIPILEYDPEKQALFMPEMGHRYAKKAVLLLMRQEVEEYVSTHPCEIVGQFENITKVFYVYQTVHKGTEIAFCQTPLGGAGAVQIMEELIAGGAEEIIAAGSCGALIKDVEGEFFVPTAALRQEGASYHYLPPAREVELDETAVRAIEKALTENGESYRRCKTWTTDGFFRETKELVLYRKEEGYSVVEMECASLAACAKMRGVRFGQLLFAADSLANVENYDERTWGMERFAYAIKLAFDAAVEMKP